MSEQPMIFSKILCLENMSLQLSQNSSLPISRGLVLDHTKSFSEVLELHFGQRLGQYIGYLLVHFHILELYCSSLHHIPDIVELDLDVLRLVSRCALTCHGTLGSPTTSRNSDCHRRYKSHLTGDQTNQTVAFTSILPHNQPSKWQHTLPQLYSVPRRTISC